MAVCLLISTLSLHAADIETVNKILLRMASDDFDDREAATDAAAALPPPWAKALAKMAAGYARTDPEVSSRLRLAILRMFLRQALPMDERWMRTHGAVEFEYSDVYGENWVVRLYKAIFDKDQDVTSHVIVVSTAWGDCEDRLKNWDVITHIDGKTIPEANAEPMAQYGMFVPGREYVLTIRRPKDPDAISARGTINDEDGFDVISVKVRAKWESHPLDSPHGVSMYYLRTSERMAWNAWIIEAGIDAEFEAVPMDEDYYPRSPCEQPPFRP